LDVLVYSDPLTADTCHVTKGELLEKCQQTHDPFLILEAGIDHLLLGTLPRGAVDQSYGLGANGLTQPLPWAGAFGGNACAR
jgi:hypothetical protein